MKYSIRITILLAGLVVGYILGNFIDHMIQHFSPKQSQASAPVTTSGSTFADSLDIMTAGVTIKEFMPVDSHTAMMMVGISTPAPQSFRVKAYMSRYCAELGYLFAKNSGATVMNMSFGFPIDSAKE